MQLRRGGGRGPRCALAVEPHRAQTGAARALDVCFRIVADVHHVRGIETRIVEQPAEDARVGLETPGLPRAQTPLEEMRQPDRGQVRVAVAEREQPAACVQRREGRQHVVVEYDFVARAEEDIEGLPRHVFRVACLARQPAQQLEPQPGEIVLHGRMLDHEPRAQRTHRGQRVSLEDARIGLREELGQPLLGTQDHRLHIPERVVEVEDQRVYPQWALRLYRSWHSRIAVARRAGSRLERRRCSARPTLAPVTPVARPRPS